MAQTGYTPILIYSSSTASNAPSAANLTNSTLGSELAINITDGKLFYKDNGGSVQVIGWKTVPTSAGGTGLTSYTAGDTLYYASGTAFTKLAIGTAYQMLGVNAGATAPSWQPSATSVLTTQGDLLYASAANTLARLAKSTTATRYLANTGTTNNPQWDQVNLTNGVTGTLPTTNGGTGLASFTVNGIAYASSTSALATGSALTFDGTNFATTGSANVKNLLLTAGTLPGAGNPSIALRSSDNTIYHQSGTANTFVFLDKDQNTMAIVDKTNGISVYGANFVQGTAAKGINFTANTGAAGMTSQLLNWYEEGTFTPTLAGSTGNPTPTYTTQVGYYTRVGRLVNIYIQLFTSSYTGGSGTLQVKSLPYAATNGARFDINTVRITFGASAVQVCGAVDGGSTTIYFDESNSNAADTTLALSAWNSGASAGMTIYGSYIV